MKHYQIFLRIILWLSIGLIIGNVIFLMCLGKSVESQGYGGSPGHMTPNEVDEMWQKNHK